MDDCEGGKRIAGDASGVLSPDEMAGQIDEGNGTAWSKEPSDDPVSVATAITRRGQAPPFKHSITV